LSSQPKSAPLAFYAHLSELGRREEPESRDHGLS